MNSLSEIQKKRLFNTVITVVILFAVFLAVRIIDDIKAYSFIGGGVYPSRTITITGTGEVYAVPDIGSFSFSVDEQGKTVEEAQNLATTKMNSIIDALKSMGIEDKDIQTTGYNTGPKYEWNQTACTSVTTPVGVSSSYCPPGKSVLVGYEVSQTISVKIRKTDQAGEVLTKVGQLGATNISSLSFVVDDIEAVKSQAREKAIADAKAKAKTLSKALGIELSKIISYSDTNYPVYYGTSNAMKSMAAAGDVAAAPVVPVGENQTVINVSITYEID